MNEDFNKEFLKLSEKDQKSILNLIEFKNKQKQSMYKQRINLAIKLLIKLFGTDDYEINYIIGILNGQREIYSLDEVELDLESKGE